MSGEVLVVLERDGLKVTRHAEDVDRNGRCEHRLNRDGGLPSVTIARTVRAVVGVTHAYYTSIGGGTVFYGLAIDVQSMYAPVADCVITAVLATLRANWQ